MLEKIEVLKTEETKGATAEPAASFAEDRTIVKFKKPYKFEGNEYNEVDLTEIENLTAEDLVETEKVFNTLGGFSMMPEMSPLYAFIIASRATKKPLEFYRKLPIKEGLLVKNTVVGFLNS